MEDISKFGKGGVIKPVDLRDYRLEVVAGAPDGFPTVYEITFGGKVKNQNGSLSCVSQATSYYAEVLNWKETGEWTELSPKFIYAQVHRPEGGSRVADNMDVMCNQGICTESELPSYNAGMPPHEDFMINLSDITQQDYDNATTYLAKSYVTWDNMNIDSYKQAIMTGSGCIIISWGNNPCWQTGDIQLPFDRSQLNWTHGIYLVGWDDNKQAFKFLNSWGANWGHGGYGYLPYSYFTSGYILNPCTLIDLPNQTYSLLQKLIGLYKNIISLLCQKKQN